MPTLRRCTNVVEAQQILGFLRAQGVSAACLSASSGSFGHSPHLIVVDDINLAAAEALLAEFDSLPGLSRDWEAQVAPDLSKLPTGVEITCPSCSEVFAPAAHGACPACSSDLDVVELLLSRYGPEVLERCYPEPEPLDDEVLSSANVECPECRYNLAGLAPRGCCPECGITYDKADLLQRRQGM